MATVRYAINNGSHAGQLAEVDLATQLDEETSLLFNSVEEMQQWFKENLPTDHPYKNGQLIKITFEAVGVN